MIQISELRKNFNGNRALDAFSLEVAEGELFGLVGPNGAGKTTLIKTLATLIKPSSGSVRIAGMDVQENRDAVKQITGYLPDQPGVYQDMRLREFLQFFADAFHVDRERQSPVIESALRRAGLADRSDAFVEELSFGLKQRLVLAKTLLHNPKVLLLDEPATGLDPIARLDLRRELQQLNAEGVTILISSHILSDLEDICTRVALISNGKNAADADGNQIIQLRRAAAPTQIYEVEVLGSIENALQATTSVFTATVLKAENSRLLVQLAGSKAEAAALLQSLIAAGVQVASFAPRSTTLEERYQKAFGGTKP
ncbi:MAG TPA: ABC transporter ATP-binding protein [Terriglobales bacterium]|jgi:ABC-2 type transport system ATP-binding protein